MVKGVQMSAKDPEVRRAIQRRYYLKNRDKILAKQQADPIRLEKKRLDYLKNREAILAKQRLDYAQNPEKYAVKNKATRERNSAKIRQGQRLHYLKNREKIIAQSTAYHNAHAEETRLYQQGYRQRNRDKKRGYQTKYEAKNRVVLALKLKLRRRAHPEILAAQQRRRRARQANAPINDLTAAQWQEIQDAFGNRCVYCPDDCKACQKKRHKLTPDHVTPYAKNGSNTLWNVVPACKSCNSKKGPRAPLKPVQPLLLTVAPNTRPKAS
jgi:5-methylcytosine-specific restriction endonuclease McrA